MPNLIESPIYEPGIYQLETTDPVMGGANGIDNLQAKQLANRTKWLKDKVILSVLLAKSQNQLLTASVFNPVTFDQIIRNDDNIVSSAPPITAVTVPAGFTQARISANETILGSTTMNLGIYSSGLMKNGSQISQFSSGQGRKASIYNTLAVSEYVSINMISPFIPVVPGDTLGIFFYTGTTLASILGGQSWMQIEFIK